MLTLYSELPSHSKVFIYQSNKELNNKELSQIAAVSQANFKIGIRDKEERLYDLIINLKGLDFDVFRVELKRYLNILKKQ